MCVRFSQSVVSQPPRCGFGAVARTQVERDRAVWGTFANRVVNQFKFSQVLGRHAHSGADDNAVVCLRAEAIQDRLIQLIVATDGDADPPPLKWSALKYGF